MSCNLQYSNNKLVQVVNDQGQPSQLYREAVSNFGEEKALDIFLTSKSDNFTEIFGNEEPSLQTVMKYITEENKITEPLNKEQIVDLQDFDQNVSVDTLVNTFYDEFGIFSVSAEKLKASKLYSDYEIRNLQNDVELQEKVKLSLEALINTENAEESLPQQTQTEKTGIINSFGKLVSINPEIIEKEIVEKLGGTTQDEFNQIVEDIDYPKFQDSLQKPVDKSLIKRVIDQLKKTKLANTVFVLSNEEIVNKLVELGVSEKLAKQVVAWHGSPYSFKKFTTNAMGTGEGAQAFGWGLYFTDLESIARNYAEKLSNYQSLMKDIVASEQDKKTAFDILAGFEFNKGKTLEVLRSRDDGFGGQVSEHMSVFNKQMANLIEQIKGRNLYKVSLHKGKEAGEYTWLEWDKKINKDQRNILANVFEKNKFLKEVKGFKKEIFIENDNLIGDDVYSFISDTLGGQKEASLFLLRAGIDGIKYPAESISSGATSDTARGFNYVVFDENAVTIEEQIQFQRVADQLPLTLQVFERPEFVKLQGKQVNPITVLNSLNQSGIRQIEKDLIKQVIEDNYKGQKKVSFDELETTVRANIMPLERITTSSYSDYGMDNLGDGRYGEAKTLIFNAPIEHGVTGHFSGDFKASGRQNIKYQAKQLNDNTWVAVEEGYESQANDNNIYQYVGTAGTKEAVDEWIENYENPGNLLLEEDNSLTIRVSPTTQAIRDSFPEVDVVKVELLKNGEVVYVRSNSINNEDNEFLRKRAIENYNLSRGKELDRDTQAINKGMFGHIRVWENKERDFNLRDESNKFDNEMYQKYGGDWQNKVNPEERAKALDFIKRKRSENQVFYVAELQSDYFQKNNAKKSLLKLNDILYSQEYIELFQKVSEKRLLENESKVEVRQNETKTQWRVWLGDRSYGVYETKEEAEANKYILGKRLVNESVEDSMIEKDPEIVKFVNKKLEKQFNKLSPQEKQFIASQKIWEQRMVREAIKEASLSGATSLRFPTPYTLSVIEGYITKVEGSGMDAGLKEYLDSISSEPNAGDILTFLDEEYIVIEYREFDNSIQIAKLRNYDRIESGEEFDEQEFPYYIETDETTYIARVQPDSENISIDENTVGSDSFSIEENLNDTQQTVARKYEEIAEILKKEKPVEVVTDENGFDWYEAKITQEDVQKPVVAFQKTPKDITMTTSGFVYKGSVYLNEDKMKLDTPVHEFGHLYLNWLKSERGDLYQKGLELAQSEGAKEYADYVEKTQPNLTGEDRLNEILAQAIGDNGAKLADKSWIGELWDEIKKLFGLSQYTNKQIQNMNLEQFTKAIAVDLYKEDLFKQMQEYKKADVFIEVEGEIRQKNNVETEITIPLTTKIITNEAIKDSLDNLLNINLDILSDNYEQTEKVLTAIENELISNGLDVVGLSKKPIDSELIEFLKELTIFINSPTRENTKSYANLSDEYFERDVTPQKTVIKTDKKLEYVTLNTNLSEEEVYTKSGLIKVKDNLYIKSAKESLEKLYSNLETYTEKYPKDKTIQEYVQEQIAKTKGFNNAENAEAVYLYKMYFEIESQEVHLQNKQLERKVPIFTKKDLESDRKSQEAKRAFENYTDIMLPLSANYQDLLVLMDSISNGEVLDKLPYNLIEEDYSATESDIRNLISKYDRALDRLELIDSNLREVSTKKTQNFTGDAEYLTGEFISDFWAKALKAKQKDNADWRNYYSHFGVNERGLYLINNDSITMSKIELYADENIKQYSILSKQMPNIADKSEGIQSLRDEAINNPNSVKVFEGQVSRLNEKEIVLKDSTDEFVRIGDDIFENIATESNLKHYVKLEKNNSEYYVVNTEKPKSELKLSDYKYLETTTDKFTTVKKYLANQNLEEFNC